MDEAFATLGVVGGLLVAAGAVVLLMGWGGLHERLPTQVPPPRYARYAFAAGAALLAIAGVGLAVPGG